MEAERIAELAARLLELCGSSFVAQCLEFADEEAAEEAIESSSVIAGYAAALGSVERGRLADALIRANSSAYLARAYFHGGSSLFYELLSPVEHEWDVDGDMVAFSIIMMAFAVQHNSGGLIELTRENFPAVVTLHSYVENCLDDGGRRNSSAWREAQKILDADWCTRIKAYVEPLDDRLAEMCKIMDDVNEAMEQGGGVPSAAILTRFKACADRFHLRGSRPPSRSDSGAGDVSSILGTLTDSSLSAGDNSRKAQQQRDKSWRLRFSTPLVRPTLPLVLHRLMHLQTALSAVKKDVLNLSVTNWIRYVTKRLPLVRSAMSSSDHSMISQVAKRQTVTLQEAANALSAMPSMRSDIDALILAMENLQLGRILSSLLTPAPALHDDSMDVDAGAATPTAAGTSPPAAFSHSAGPLAALRGISPLLASTLALPAAVPQSSTVTPPSASVRLEARLLELNLVAPIAADVLALLSPSDFDELRKLAAAANKEDYARLSEEIERTPNTSGNFVVVVNGGWKGPFSTWDAAADVGEASMRDALRCFYITRVGHPDPVRGPPLQEPLLCVTHGSGAPITLLASLSCTRFCSVPVASRWWVQRSVTTCRPFTTRAREMASTASPLLGLASLSRIRMRITCAYTVPSSATRVHAQMASVTCWCAPRASPGSSATSLATRCCVSSLVRHSVRLRGVTASSTHQTELGPCLREKRLSAHTLQCRHESEDYWECYPVGRAMHCRRYGGAERELRKS